MVTASLRGSLGQTAALPRPASAGMKSSALTAGGAGRGGGGHASGSTPITAQAGGAGRGGHVRSFRANPPHGIDTQTRRRQSCAHEGWPHAPRTIGDDVDAVWGEAGPQHRVLLAGVGDADGLVHVGQHALE